MNFNVNLTSLEKVALDEKVFLATNIADMPDCSGAPIELKTEIINRFPLVEWLLRTQLTQRVRTEIYNGGLCLVHKDSTTGKWVIEAPREIWTEIPEASETEECCWQPFEFAKCGGTFPLNLLCLKSCEDMMDILIDRIVSIGADIPDIASRNEKLREVKRRVDRLSMAFYTAYTAILGHDSTYTNILKPFHGLAQVMENPAVATINGTNILAAFDSAACRMSLLGGNNFVFAINPVLYQGLLNEIRPGQYGLLPAGWTRDGDVIRFHGMGFVQDRLVPVDMETGTGEIWILNGESVGLFLATNLMPSDDFIRESGDYTKTPGNGCAEECIYYYNLGTALANNANKIMRIVDVPLSGACTVAIGDLADIVVPQTLIPNV